MDLIATRWRTMYFAPLLLTLTAFATIGLNAYAQQSAPQLPADLEKVRQALDKYQDPIVAVHDGYFSTIGCVDFPKAGGPGEVPYPTGGMGVHFFNIALLGAELDPVRPQVLVYAPLGDKLKLIAAEWFIPLSTGIKERPKLLASRSMARWKGIIR